MKLFKTFKKQFEDHNHIMFKHLKNKLKIITLFLVF